MGEGSRAIHACSRIDFTRSVEQNGRLCEAVMRLSPFGWVAQPVRRVRREPAY